MPCPFASGSGPREPRATQGGASRRSILAAAGGLLAPMPRLGTAAAATPGTSDTVPFHGQHQAGIATPQQTHVVFAAFDLTTNSASELARVLQLWTDAAANLTAGKPLADNDTLEIAGAGPRRLTLTFGFGPGLFQRVGLDARRPAPLAELPVFTGDQLDPARSGGDLCIQACADDPAVAFHAIRQLARLASADDAARGYGGKAPGATAASAAHPGVAALRWIQTGFLPDTPSGDRPRNLLGFKDGTQNPGMPHMAERAGGKLTGNGSFADNVWAGDEGPSWMRGGTYMVVRRIRLSLEHWDTVPVDFQEQVIGRHKQSGAPLTGGDEFAVLDLDAVDRNGDPVIPENAHVRLASAAATGGARIARRSYSYNDGLSMVAERWPPWRQGLEYDAGLLFVAFQRDPHAGFIPMFEKMSKFDMLNQFATHVGSAVFAVPPGARPGEFIGQGLFTLQKV